MTIKRSRISYLSGLDKLAGAEEEEDPATAEVCSQCPLEGHCAVEGYVSMVEHNVVIHNMQADIHNMQAEFRAAIAALQQQVALSRRD